MKSFNELRAATGLGVQATELISEARVAVFE